MKNTKKLYSALYVMALAAIVVLAAKPMTVSATEESIPANRVMMLQSDTDIKEEASENSATVATLTAGTGVVTLEDSSDGWVKVRHQETQGYVQISAITNKADDGLDAEFEQMANESRLMFEVMQYEYTQNQQKLIWGVVIGGLIVAMFVVGIITGVDSKKRKKNK